MAAQRFSLPLNAASFPLITSDQQRAVIVPSSDVSSPRLGNKFSGTEDSINYNIPQILYCENVIPVAEGLKSVGYRTVIPAYVEPEEI